jgi:hypothetical protein
MYLIRNLVIFLILDKGSVFSHQHKSVDPKMLSSSSDVSFQFLLSVGHLGHCMDPIITLMQTFSLQNEFLISISRQEYKQNEE